MKLHEIQTKIQNLEFEISLHAFEEAVDDFISLNDVVGALLHGELIEDYPERSRCLIYCKVKYQHIHVVIDYYDYMHGLSPNIEIVTIYAPDPDQWHNFRKRIC